MQLLLSLEMESLSSDRRAELFFILDSLIKLDGICWICLKYSREVCQLNEG